MRVAFLHRDLPPDSFTGVAIQVHRLANALTDLGVHIDVFTISLTPENARYQTRPAMVRQNPISAFFTTFFKRLAYPYLFQHIDFSYYDLVHIHGDGAWIDYKPHFLRTFYGSAYYERDSTNSLKGWLAQNLSWMAEKTEAKKCKHQSAISAHLKNALPQLERIIPCMLDSDTPFSVPVKSPYPTMIHVGSLYGRKQGFKALEILSELKAQGHRWRLHLVCPEKEAKNISTQQWGSDVILHSNLSTASLKALYAESWLCLSLSSYEGFGLPIIEALSQGCPILSNPHQGAVDLLGKDWPESLCPIYHMVPRIMHLEKELTNGNWPIHRCFDLAMKFNPSVVAGQYLKWYHQVLGEQPK